MTSLTRLRNSKYHRPMHYRRR